MPYWMTSSVVGLLERIKRDSAWDVLPILADALEEGGYADGPALLAMRSGDPLLAKPWLRRVVEGTVTFTAVKEAVDWLTAHAENSEDLEFAEGNDDLARPVRGYGRTLEWLMLACELYARDAEEEYFSYDNPEEAYEAVGDVWRYYWVLAGLPQPVGLDEEKRCPVVALSYAC